MQQSLTSLFQYPLRRYPLRAALVVTCALCALAIVYVDYPLAGFISEQAGPQLLKVFWLITIFGSVIFWQAGSFLLVNILFLAVWLRGLSGASQRLRDVSLCALYFFISLISGSLVVFAIKELVGRLRPSFLIHDIVPNPDNFLAYHEALSFPSGHSANAFAAATALGFIFPRHRLILLILAALVGLSRIILNAHFLSDVLMGAYIGIAAAVLVHRWFKRIGISVVWPQGSFH